MIIKCPICHKQFEHPDGSSPHKLRSNLLQHMVRGHHIQRSHGSRMLEDMGIVCQGTDLDVVVKEYEELVAAGVIVE